MPFQNGRVPMTQRSQGGVFVAYAHGYPSPNAVRLWRIGGTGFETIAKMNGIGEVAIAADPNGKIWGLWARNGRIYARRSNEAVTRWGKTVTTRYPRNTVGITTLQADAQARGRRRRSRTRQQVGNSGFFHTQLEPGISFRARPKRFPQDEPHDGDVQDQGRRRSVAELAHHRGGRELHDERAGSLLDPAGPVRAPEAPEGEGHAHRLRAGQAQAARHPLTGRIFQRVRGGTYAVTTAALAALALAAPRSRRTPPSRGSTSAASATSSRAARARRSTLRSSPHSRPAASARRRSWTSFRCTTT